MYLVGARIGGNGVFQVDVLFTVGLSGEGWLELGVDCIEAGTWPVGDLVGASRVVQDSGCTEQGATSSCRVHRGFLVTEKAVDGWIRVLAGR